MSASGSRDNDTERNSLHVTTVCHLQQNATQTLGGVYVDRQNSSEPALYLYRTGAAYSHSEPGRDFEYANGHLSGHQYSCCRHRLDLYWTEPGVDGRPDHARIRAQSYYDGRQHRAY